MTYTLETLTQEQPEELPRPEDHPLSWQLGALMRADGWSGRSGCHHRGPQLPGYPPSRRVDT